MGKVFRSLSASLLIATFGSRVMAQTPPLEPPVNSTTAMVTPSATYPIAVLPDHLNVGNQQYDASVEGLRTYLETTKNTNPQLYGQLAPDLGRLESNATMARGFLIAGAVVGAAALTYGILGGKNCASPSVDDPNFAKDVNAWGACNDDNLRFHSEFALLGLGSLLAGGITWMALHPNRTDLFALVSKHNQLSQQPLHFEIGYNPAQHLSYGGATLTF